MLSPTLKSNCRCSGFQMWLHSSSTCEDKKHRRFPNPYFHNPWYKKRGHFDCSQFGLNVAALRKRFSGALARP